MSRRGDEVEFELDRDARAFLAALRAEERMPDEVGARVWSRLESEATPDRGRRSRLSVVIFVGLAIAAAVLLAVAVGRGPSLAPANTAEDHQAGYERTESEPTSPATERSGPVRSVAPPVPAEAEPVPAEAEPVPAEAEPVGPPSGPTSTSAPPKPNKPPRSPPPAIEQEPLVPPSPDDLAEEAAMLRRAQRELVEGRPDAALALLREATTRFESGALIPERAALEVVALCDAGRVDDGVAARREFLRRYPDSPLRARVREACGP